MHESITETGTARKLMTRDEVAQLLAAHRQSVYRWTKEGRIPHVRIGHAVRYHWPDVARALGIDEGGDHAND